MLVLTRRPGQSVIIFDQDGKQLGRVMLIKVGSSDQVRIGFDFPLENGVVREEIVGGESVEAKPARATGDHP
jgi:sRNA-binding carbon storage regulator CsrA